MAGSILRWIIESSMAKAWELTNLDCSKIAYYAGMFSTHHQ